MRKLNTDVIIIGAGIAGPALAAALADSGLRVVIVERGAEPLDTARGDHLQPRTVEILEQWGALDAIRSRGAERRDRTIWYGSDGEAILDANVSSLDIPHPYFLFLNHEAIGDALLEAAGRSQDFELLRPVRAWRVIDQTEVAVRLHATLADDSQVELHGRVLVGADGRNSQVRRVAAIDAERTRYARPIVVLFGRFDPLPDGNALTAYVTQHGIVALIPRTGGGCKVGISTAPAEIGDWRDAAGPELKSRLAETLPTVPVSDLTYGGIYPPIRLATQAWTAGNTVLIGDACHALHPAQSQGMNVSIRCIHELARFLSEDSDTPAHALASYERATRPVIEPVLDANHRAGLLFDTLDRDELDSFAAALREVARSADGIERYALRTAGYASPGD